MPHVTLKTSECRYSQWIDRLGNRRNRSGHGKLVNSVQFNVFGSRERRTEVEANRPVGGEGDTDIGYGERADIRFGRSGEQARFRQPERQGRGGVDTGILRLAAGAIETGGQIDRQHWRRLRVRTPDQICIAAARRPVQAESEQRIDHQIAR